jgi:hypothetical protein
MGMLEFCKISCKVIASLKGAAQIEFACRRGRVAALVGFPGVSRCCDRFIR